MKIRMKEQNNEKTTIDIGMRYKVFILQMFDRVLVEEMISMGGLFIDEDAIVLFIDRLYGAFGGAIFNDNASQFAVRFCENFTEELYSGFIINSRNRIIVITPHQEINDTLIGTGIRRKFPNFSMHVNKLTVPSQNNDIPKVSFIKEFMTANRFIGPTDCTKYKSFQFPTINAYPMSYLKSIFKAAGITRFGIRGTTTDPEVVLFSPNCPVSEIDISNYNALGIEIYNCDE